MMKATTVVLAASALSLAGLASGQTAVNAKILHNTQHTDSTTRFDSNATDTLYYMQPALSRTGYGNAIGWQGVLQDEDYQTSEAVQFAFVRYAQNGTQPDVTAQGVIGNASANLQFPQPAQGTASAVLWTLTLQSSVAVPATSGIRLVLPPANSQTDGVSVHTQRGQTSRLPVALRKQYTFHLANNQANAFFGAATTLRIGGIWVEPVTQMFVKSNVYGSSEDLFGPEAIHPSATAGDQIGFQMTGGRFASQVAVLLISGGLAPQPIQAGIGTLYLSPPFGAIVLPFALDQTGVAKSPTVAVPSGLKIWSQTACLHTQSGLVRMSDATGIEVQ